MWMKWLPWRFVVRRVARARGFVDPITLLSQLHRFAQPSEVEAPLELLRAGVVFHARGLMNTGAIQHNLDWVWPFWVERQFDPRDEAFIPRAFSATHVNLTHRNWTALGAPDFEETPLVDPRGLLTPFWDGWSIDAWVVAQDGEQLIPSRARDVVQRLDLGQGVAVATESSTPQHKLSIRADVVTEDRGPVCRQRMEARSNGPAWLVVSLRPYNPEGVCFIHDVQFEMGKSRWLVEGDQSVELDQPPDRCQASTYRESDVHARLFEEQRTADARCEVGMVTAAAMYALAPHEPRTIEIKVPLEAARPAPPPGQAAPARSTWPEALAGCTSVTLPDAKQQFLFDAALRTLVLHSPGDVYPGPYTYKRFWFRDAAFILHAMLNVGLTDRARRAIDRFFPRQTRGGYFRSQEGEWDSNGEVLWLLDRFRRLTGAMPETAWEGPIERAANWIVRKRLPERPDSPHAGLLPAGFSAEHLGPNDYYYWDDFWSAAGLRSAAKLMEWLGRIKLKQQFSAEADRLLGSLDRSLAASEARRDRVGAPASPYRRMDSGAIGSVVASYPLQLWSSDDPRLQGTIEFLLENCCLDNGFFQDMIHSGVNVYLTLHLAQCLLRQGDVRFRSLMQAAADLASPTGQWPEAIHPRTRGGCMGDGQHVWAAAEWVMMVRNLFVREEGDRLILASGVDPAWLEQGAPCGIQQAPTPFGPISVSVESRGDRIHVRWQGDWRGDAPPVVVRLPGFAASASGPGTCEAVYDREPVR